MPILIAAGVIALVCVFHFLPRLFPDSTILTSFRRLEWITYDMRTVLAASRPQPYATNLLAGVFITDQDLLNMSDGTFGYAVKFPWPAYFHGKVVRELTEQGAIAIGFDVIFELLDETATVALPDGAETNSDGFFADQLRQAGNVVLASEVEGSIFPAELFRTNASAMANIYTARDSDGVLRRVKAFTEYRDWHPEVDSLIRDLDLDPAGVELKSDRIVFPYNETDDVFELPLNPDGSAPFEDYSLERYDSPQMPFTMRRVWNLGIVMAARGMGLDLQQSVIEPNQILLRGDNGLVRRIPTDSEGYFYVNWSLPFEDSRITDTSFANLVRDDDWRVKGQAVEEPLFRDKLVIIGSTGTGGNIADLGTTPLGSRTPLVMKHFNVANSIVTGRFVRVFTPGTELLLILLMGSASGLLTWRLRAIAASLTVLAVMSLYAGIGILLFITYGYWLPVVLPLFGALLLTHVGMVTYRVMVEQKERHRVRSIFSKLVAPEVVNELLQYQVEQMSVRGAQRKVSVYFADVRGFTRMTDEVQAYAEAYVREHQLSPPEAEAYLDAQAGEVLDTVNRYLGLISEIVKKHSGTLDKYIGDCVMAFWGAPINNDRHAVDCVRAAIAAQRAIYELNLSRAAENKRREEENARRLAAGEPRLDLLTLLALGSGINSGTVTVGLMGSEEHGLNYTVFGREVNLASRLEGVSGRGRIIVGEGTYQELHRLEPDLAAKCIELPPQEVKGFRDAVKLYEVQWRTMDAEMESFDTGILTGRRVSVPTDFIGQG